jgi:N4-gp56 family major capsid protein
MAKYFSQKIIARLEPNTPLIEFAVKDDLPLRTGTTATFNGWRVLDAASVSLGEGAANSLPALSSRKVVATIVGYGRGVKLTDLFQMTSFFDAVNGAMDVLTDSARKTVERMVQMGIFKNGIGLNSTKTGLLSAWMTSTASSFCLNTGTASNSNQFQFPVIIPTSSSFLSNYNASAPTTSSQLSLFSVRKCVTTLRGYDAQPFADGYYIGYAHPLALHSLRKDPTWVQWNVYQNSQETMYKGEAGKVEKVRFIDSTLAPRYAVAAHSIDLVFIFGQGAYGFTSLDGMVKMMIARGPDKSDTWDQFTPVTYKIYGAAVALNCSAGRILAVAEKL